MNQQNKLADELREYTAMKYVGDCKCGKCQLVPRELIDRVCAALRAAGSAEPVAWITKAALENWQKGHDPEKHVLLRSGHHNDLRVPLYLAAPAESVREEIAIAQAICCPDGCSFLGDSEDGNKCYCDTSDYNGSGIEKKAKAAILALTKSGRQQ